MGMDKELEQFITKRGYSEKELESGKFLAETLVEHLIKMGAGGCIIPVNVKGKGFEVSIREV